jgi:hypothetical protein
METGGKYKNMRVTHIGTIQANGHQMLYLIRITGGLGIAFK